MFGPGTRLKPVPTREPSPTFPPDPLGWMAVWCARRPRKGDAAVGLLRPPGLEKDFHWRKILVEPLHFHQTTVR
jgi:hypothetical protein